MILFLVPMLCALSTSATETEPIRLHCGLSALYVMAALEKIPADLEQLNRLLPPDREGTTSMLDIVEAGRAIGLSLTGVRLGPNDPIDRVMLIHLDRKPSGHFVTARPIGHTGKLIQVFDSPLEPYVVDQDLFRARPEWTGVVLEAARPNLGIRLAVLATSVGVVGIVASTWKRVLQGPRLASSSSLNEQRPRPNGSERPSS